MAKTKKTFKQLYSNPTSKGQVSTNNTSKPETTKSHIPGRVASALETKASMRGQINARAADYLSRIHTSGLSDGDRIETLPDLPRVPDNLPAVISQAIVDSGHNFEVRWHAVRNLPGYMQSAIRAMGRAVFRPLTSTPIEDIYVVSTLSNTESEVKQVGSWIMKNGKRDDKMTLKFHDILPGYEGEVRVWKVEGYTFIVVSDFMGNYIYGFPTKRV